MENNEITELKREIKSLMARRGYTLEKLAQALNEKYDDIKESKNNLSNKLSRGSLRFFEVKRIAEVLDFDIQFISK